MRIEPSGYAEELKVEMEIEEVLGLKDSAKSARDQGDWPGALADLQDALDLLDTMAGDGSEDIAAEIADTYGMIGGIERRWALATEGTDRAEHLERSRQAYDDGFRREDRLGSIEPTTYNRINRLVARVLIRSAILVGDQGDLDIRAELAIAEEMVTEQIDDPRKRDPWAYCDLLTIQLLSGGREAESTLDALIGLRPPDFVYKSVLDTLEPLAEVASSVRPQIGSAVQRLREVVPRSSADRR
jgi:hypothetical protein